MSQSTIDMRDAFFDEVYRLAAQDKDVIFLTADHSAFSLVRFAQDFPKQYINVGIAEQNMVSVAAGLALSGKKVFAYSIVNFASLRCLEQIAVDLASMNLPVTLIGVGAGYTYASDGPTHHGTQDVAAIATMPNFSIYSSSDVANTQVFAQMAYRDAGPKYVLIEKGQLADLHKDNADFSTGVGALRTGHDLTIVASGLMTHKALAAANALQKYGLQVGVIDLYRIKPLNTTLLMELLGHTQRVAVIEEMAPSGGVASMVSNAMMENQCFRPFKRLGLPDAYCFDYHTDREWLYRQCGLDTDSLVAELLPFCDCQKVETPYAVQNL